MTRTLLETLYFCTDYNLRRDAMHEFEVPFCRQKDRFYVAYERCHPDATREEIHAEINRICDEVKNSLN